LGTIISAAQPSAVPPFSKRMRARTYTCGQAVTVAAPKRNGSRSATSRSEKRISWM
jgi:hypothetical protein